MNRDSGEIHRQATSQHHATLYSLNQLRHVAMTGVVSTASINNAYDGAIQSAIGIASTLNKCLTQKQGEAFITITG